MVVLCPAYPAHSWSCHNVYPYHTGVGGLICLGFQVGGLRSLC